MLTLRFVNPKNRLFSNEEKIDVLQSRPSAGGHKILNFTSKILDFLTTGYLPFCDFFLRFLKSIAMFSGFNMITFFL